MVIVTYLGVVRVTHLGVVEVTVTVMSLAYRGFPPSCNQSQHHSNRETGIAIFY